MGVFSYVVIQFRVFQYNQLFVSQINLIVHLQDVCLVKPNNSFRFALFQKFLFQNFFNFDFWLYFYDRWSFFNFSAKLLSERSILVNWVKLINGRFHKLQITQSLRNVYGICINAFLVLALIRLFNDFFVSLLLRIVLEVDGDFI